MRTDTYRYGIVIGGASYGLGDVTEPTHVFMATSVEHVHTILHNAAGWLRNPRTVYGSGERSLDTPAYGEDGDYAYVYMASVPSSDPVAAYESLYSWPSFRLEFGPRGGLRRIDG